MAYEVRKFLDLSTGHLKPSTREMLDELGKQTANSPQDCMTWVTSTPYGWFLYADMDADTVEDSEDLKACILKARELGCEYLMFDRDAPTIDSLLSYED